MVVCLDTHVLIWGVRGFASPGQEEMPSRARAFLEKLSRDREQVIIPAPVVAEYLIGVSPAYQQSSLEKMGKSFVIAPFDAAAAGEAARIRTALGIGGGPTVSGPNGNCNRTALKFDLLIVAVALSRKCDVIYSSDGDFKKLFSDFIPVEEIPPLPFEQVKMF